MKRKQFTPYDLALELESLVADGDKLETDSEISDWLVRLYTVAGKLTIARKACQQHFDGTASEAAHEIVSGYPSSILLLHNLAENAIAKMK